MVKPMRLAMPVVASFIDAMRASFGQVEIDRQIKAGMQGKGVFFAEENGCSIGTKPQECSFSVSGDALGINVGKVKNGRG